MVPNIVTKSSEGVGSLGMTRSYFNNTNNGGGGGLSVTDQRIVEAVQHLQLLVNTETKWRNRIVSTVTASSSIDLSCERMSEFQQQCQQRIAALRDEVVKIAEKQMLLVSFDPAVFRQWFEQLTSDPNNVTPPPAVVTAHAAARSAMTGGSSPDKQPQRGKRAAPGGAGGGSSKDNSGPQYLDNVPVPANFWQRREAQKSALAAVFLAVFDLPRLNRERAAPRPSSVDEMLYQLREATRLAASGPAQLKELMQEHRAREREIANGIDGTASASKKAASSAARTNAAAAASAKKSAAGGGIAAAASSSKRPATAGSQTGSSSDAAPLSARSCLQTGIFVHDPNSDDLALTTDLRPSDFFDIGSPRCLDQRVLHKVMTLRSRRLRLEECIAVFQDEKAQLQKRNDVQKEACHLAQYGLLAVKPLMEQTAAEEKALQARRVAELQAAGEDVLAASKRFANTLGGISGSIGSLMDASSPKYRK